MVGWSARGLGCVLLVACAATKTTESVAPTTAAPSTPAARASAGPGAGRLPPGVIQQIVRAAFPSFQQCFDDALKKDPSAHGKTATRFVIDGAGHVRLSSDLGSTGTLPPEMGPCVASRFEALQFPSHQGGDVTVVYPLKFGNVPDADTSGGDISLGASKGGVFDRDAAGRALNDAAVTSRACAKPNGPRGSGHIKVTFDPTGHVTAAELDSSNFAGTGVGVCISALFHGVHIPPFSGDPVTVGKSFAIP